MRYRSRPSQAETWRRVWRGAEKIQIYNIYIALLFTKTSISHTQMFVFFLFVLSHASIQPNTASQNIGGTDAWAIPHLKFWGTVSPSSPRSPPVPSIKHVTLFGPIVTPSLCHSLSHISGPLKQAYVKSSQKSFNRSRPRDKNSADTAETEFVHISNINIIVKKYFNTREKQLNCQAHQWLANTPHLFRLFFM